MQETVLPPAGWSRLFPAKTKPGRNFIRSGFFIAEQTSGNRQLTYPEIYANFSHCN